MKRISFKIKVLVFLEILVIIINSILGYFIWKELSFLVREISRKKIIALASTTAYFIEGEKHEEIQSEKDQQSNAYREIHEVLKNIMEANPELDDIYTLKQLEDGSWIYVAEGYETKDLDGDGVIAEDEMAALIGEPFDASPYPELFNALNNPSADYEMGCDKWGCFLSGYAPIKNKSGQTVAIAAVDIRAQDVIDFEKNTRIAIFATLGFLFVFLPLVIYLFLAFITKPISEIIKGIKNFGQDLSTRLPIKSEDEFGIISRTFNNMASELQDLYTGLEDKVREKTRSLEKKVNEIEEKKAKEEALLTSIGEGMIATDKNGKIIITNSQFEIFLRLSADKITNKKISSICNLSDDKGNIISGEKRPEIAALSHAKKTTVSLFLERADKTKFPVMITAAPVIFRNKIIGSIIVFRDITKEKEVDRAKSEFVSLASHQLLTPLANIRWYTEMLLEDNGYSEDKKKRYFSKIENSTQRMVELVQDLLNVSRIEMGVFSIETRPTNIKELMLDAISELSHKIKDKKIKILKNFDDLKSFNADPKMLRIIFQNLLSNAVKYANLNGKIEVSVSKNEKSVLIRVSNSGYGIPQNQEDKIFTKLFRADNVREEETEGTGLGLYITKSVVENSGGRIWFDSIENKNTNFYVEYPLSGMKNVKGSKKLI